MICKIHQEQNFIKIFYFQIQTQINGLAQKPHYHTIQAKKNLIKKPVLDRFDHQLKTSGLKTYHTIKPDFSWSCSNIDKIKQEYNLKKYILLFPFCSEHLSIKKCLTIVN